MNCGALLHVVSGQALSLSGFKTESFVAGGLEVGCCMSGSADCLCYDDVQPGPRPPVSTLLLCRVIPIRGQFIF